MTTNDEPADCAICGMHAIGVGLGFTHSRDKDPRWICAECALIVEDIRKVKRMDAFELKAREGGMDAGGPYIEQYGSDLSEWSEDQALQFVGAVWRGCATRIRELIRGNEAPF